MENKTLHAWLAYHSGAYPGFGKWIARNPDQVEHIGRTVEGFDLMELKAATDELYRRDKQPQGFGAHARAIVGLVRATRRPGEFDQPAGRPGPRVMDDRLTANCPTCMDYGIVSVLSPGTLQRLANDDDNHSLLCVSLRCNCQAGQAHSFDRLPMWAAGHLLLPFERILDAAIDWELEGPSDLYERMWQIAKQSLLDAAQRRYGVIG